MSKFQSGVRFVLAATLLPAIVFAADYTIDTAHSEVAFKIRHMGISKVSGRFDEFSGGFSYDPEHLDQSSARASIALSSVDTDDGKRDEHLRSPDFFDVGKYPEMIFSGGRVSVAGDEGFKLAGELTLHGVTKPVVLDVEFNGLVTDPWGNARAGFTATTKINRRNYGLSWTKNLGTGELVVGDTVYITLEVEGIAN